MPFKKGYIPWNKNKKTGLTPHKKISKSYKGKVILTKDKLAIVDKEDFERVMAYKWYFSNGYAMRHSKFKGKTVLMSHFILNVPNKIFIDHINGDGLDNRKKNLRTATPSQNQMNKNKSNNNITGYKGVSLVKDKNLKKPYIAHIKYEGKYFYLGYFSTSREAAQAYNQKALALCGEFAKLNILE